MSEGLKLQRSREQWSGCDPRLMAQQSPAAIMYALQDAKRDITALHRHADNLRAELSRLKAGQGEAVAWQDPLMPERICTAQHMAYAKTRGGAMASALKPLTVPLYTSPPSDPGTVPVLKEAIHLLSMYAPGGGSAEDFCVEELRALLAQHEGEKP